MNWLFVEDAFDYHPSDLALETQFRGGYARLPGERLLRLRDAKGLYSRLFIKQKKCEKSCQHLRDPYLPT